MLKAANPPLSGKEMRGSLGISKSLFSYHIKQLIANSFVKEEFSDGCKFYSITEEGKEYTVKSFSEGLRGQVSGLHNIGFKFKILKQPSMNFGKSITLANWTKAQLWYKDAYVYRTPSYIIIRPVPKGSRMYDADPFRAKEKARDKAMFLAQELAQKYDMILDKPEEEAKGEWAVQDNVARNLQCNIKTPEEEIDDSYGTGGEIDFKDPKKAKEYLDLPIRVAKIEDAIIKMVTLVALQAEHQGRMATDLHYVAENYKSHVGVVVKLNRLLSQKSLRDYR